MCVQLHIMVMAKMGVNPLPNKVSIAIAYGHGMNI